MNFLRNLLQTKEPAIHAKHKPEQKTVIADDKLEASYETILENRGLAEDLAPVTKRCEAPTSVNHLIDNSSSEEIINEKEHPVNPSSLSTSDDTLLKCRVEEQYLYSTASDKEELLVNFPTSLNNNCIEDSKVLEIPPNCLDKKLKANFNNLNKCSKNVANFELLKNRKFVNSLVNDKVALYTSDILDASADEPTSSSSFHSDILIPLTGFQCAVEDNFDNKLEFSVLDSHCLVEPVPKSDFNYDALISSLEINEFEVLEDEANRLADELSYSQQLPLTASTMSESIHKGDALSDSNLKSMKKHEHLTSQMNQSEAGPEVATGLTTNDIKCASQFFKEAAELESQIRKISCDSSKGTFEDDVSKTYKGVPPGCPPNEERSAPEGTSSPDPKSLDDSDSQRKGAASQSEHVNALLKKQAQRFEEKLLRQGIVAAQKEKEFNDLLKEEKSQSQKVTTSRDALLKLVEQYKGMLATLVAEKEKRSSCDEEKLTALVTDKKQALEDLANVEAAFSDVHRKYERTKQIVESLRRNEETLRKAVNDYEDKLMLQEKKFLEFKKQTEEKLKEAHEEFEVIRRSNDQEMIKMSALLKKAEMRIISLQEAVERKSRENQELSKLCDDLINKVGST